MLGGSRLAGEIFEDNQLYRLLVHNLPGMAIYMFDKDFRYLLADGPFIQTLGFTPDAIVGKTLSEFATPAFLPLLQTQYQAALEGQEVEFEAVAMGQYPYHGRVVPVRDDQGKIVAGMVIVQDMSAQKRTEQALVDSEHLYRVLMETSPEGIVLADDQGHLLRANATACQILGRTEEELRLLSRGDILDQTDARLVPARAELAQTGTAQSELKALRRDGTLFPIEVSAASFILSDGHPRSWLIFRDISNRKRQEQLLRESEGRYRLLAENSSDVVIQVDQERKWVYISPSVEQMLGYPPDELLGVTLDDLIHPDDAAMIQSARTTALQRHPLVAEAIEVRLRHKQGHYVWIERTGRPFYSEQTRGLLGGIATLRDVSARRQAEDALRESEIRYRSVVSALSEGVVLYGQNGSRLACNPSAERILGLTADEITVQSIFDPRWRVVTEDGSPFSSDMFPVVITLRTGRSVSGVIMGVYAPNGTRRWISVNSEALIHPGESLPYAAVATFIDITAHHQAEVALRESESRFRLITETSHDSILLIDNQREQLVFANPAACQLFGRDETDLLTAAYSELLDRTDPRFEHMMEEFRQTGTAHGELTGFRLNHTPFPLGGSIVSFPVRDGQASLSCAMLHDMSEYYRYQQALLEQERLQTALAKETEFSQLKTRMMERQCQDSGRA